MTRQPEALRLAKCLDEPLYATHKQITDAAAELRRLHAENKRIRSALNGWMRENSPGGWIDDLRTQRDALLEACEAMLLRDEKNTCRHEETHRGGAIWEICDSCGAMWADDQGGKPEWEDPKEWTQARDAIKAVEETK